MGLVVLVLNCGSSTVKFQVIEVEPAAGGPALSFPERTLPPHGGPAPGFRRLARGIVERIGAGASVRFEAANQPLHQETGPVEDHGAAVQRIIAWLGGRRVDVVGHRVVHGGDRFRESVLVDEEVAAAIEQVSALAPLHNAPSLAAIRAARAALGPGVPMMAVFDTAFHATLPERAHRYAIPYELSLRHGIRRFGFHGTSYRAVLARYGQLTATPPEQTRLIALHLGNGCSVAAIRNGTSVDTSMGFTPLEGLVMGTRAGDLDPSLVGYLARVEGLSVDAVDELLNERSGLLGVSGVTNDMRDLLAHAQAGDARARLAVDLFCYRARKYVGAYLAALGGADAIVFTGGIGEHLPAVRAGICEGMAWCGLTLDAARNEAAAGGEAQASAGWLISPDGARLPAYVIPTDEELVIALDAARGFGGASHPRSDTWRPA
jgi:acetate kinase